MRQAVWPHGPLVAALLISTLGSGLADVKPADTGTTRPVQTARSVLPLSFERNCGQSEAEVRFLGRGNGHAVFLTATGAVLALRQSPDASMPQLPSVILSSAPNLQRPTALRMNLVGTNPNPMVVGVEELPGRVNYLRGDNPQHWRTNIPTYAKVKYADVYPGVALIYHGNQGQLEYDFVVAPGVDLHIIRLAFTGPIGASVKSALTVAADGDLILQAEGGEVRFHAPRIYQEIGGKKQPVSGRYALFCSEAQESNHKIPEVGFEVVAYDSSKPLVIDPVLDYSTYLGGSGADIGIGIAVDPLGEVYVTGQTRSTNFPMAHPLRPMLRGPSDAFVAKLDATSSTLVYSTYLGCNGEENISFDGAIAVDAAGSAYVTGKTVRPISLPYIPCSRFFTAPLTHLWPRLILRVPPSCTRPTSVAAKKTRAEALQWTSLATSIWPGSRGRAIFPLCGPCNRHSAGYSMLLSRN